jgi:tRNA A-37 threonylcarbamoyl transferase component Bud32
MTNKKVTLEILEQVDSGLYGRVFRARQVNLDRIVAVKVIKQEYSQHADAVEHARALARVGVHPNIVTVYGVETVVIEKVSVPAMIMEWLEGEKFAVRLGGPRFSEQELRRLCGGLLDGMERMHGEGMHHGDLHFGNVILLSDCHPKIIDIDATQNRSLGRLSTISREGAIAADVDYCRKFVAKAFAHSVLSPSLCNQLDAELQGVGALVELRRIVEHAVTNPRTLGNAALVARRAVPQTAEDLCDKVAEYVEQQRPASLQGLVMGQVQLMRDEFLGDRFHVTAPGNVREQMCERVKQYEEFLAPLLSAVATGSYWGDESHWGLWKQCIETAANCYEDTQSHAGNKGLIDLRQYPPLLLLYAASLGAFLNDRFATLRFLRHNLEYFHMERQSDLVEELIYWNGEQISTWNDVILGDGRNYTPISDHLSEVCFDVTRHLVPLRATFDVQFDRLEYFVGLMVCGKRPDVDAKHTFAPTGTFLWRRAQEPEFGSYFVKQAEDRGRSWPPFQAGLFDKDPSILGRAVEVFDAYVDNERSRRHMRFLRQ